MQILFSYEDRPAVSVDPAAPAAGLGRLYNRNWAGAFLPFWRSPSGQPYALQRKIGQGNVRAWCGGATTSATTFAATIGAMPYTGASPTAPTIPGLAVGTVQGSSFRSTISTGATAGALAYIRGNQTIVYRGSGGGVGGFFFSVRFGLSALQTGMRAFAGLVDVAANPTNIDPTTTTTPGGVGLAINANTGNWNLVNNASGTARTVLALGASFPVNTTDILELALWCAPSDSGISYQVTNLSSGATTSGKLTANIPGVTALLAASVWITNNATAAAATLDFVSACVETDY